MAVLSEADIARKSAKGSLILFAGNILATTINAAAIVAVARLLGPDEYGTYSISLVAPNLLIMFVGLGVNVSVTRYSAHYLSLGRVDDAKRFTWSAILFLSAFGLALSMLNYFLANAFSAALVLRPTLADNFRQASLYVLGSTLLATVTAAATGWNMMGLASVSQVLQAAVKLVVAPGLVLAGLGVFGAIEGHVLSFLVAGSIGIVALCLLRLRQPLKPSSFIADVSGMIRFGAPVFLGSVIGGLASYYVTILLAVMASNMVFGFYQAALNFALPISLVSMSIGGAFFPAFASLAGVKGDLKMAFRLSVKYVSFLIVPIALFLIVAAPVLVGVFYGSSFSQTTIYLQLLAFSYLPLALGNGILPVFFNGIGRTRLNLYFSLGGSLLLVTTAPLLALHFDFGVSGLIYALTLANFTSLGLGLALAGRSIGARADLRSVAMVLLSSVIAAGVLMVIPRFTWGPLMLLIQIAVFTFCYLTLAPILGAIHKEDADRLGLVLGEIKGIGYLLRGVLGYEALLADRLR